MRHEADASSWGDLVMALAFLPLLGVAMALAGYVIYAIVYLVVARVAEWPW